ncbi:hypothetical protein CRU98_10040 [Arcobacter sp. CECT 8986]|uniref:hypothetical protein n=1 Tax=Arcobacter sp. CECT 8986 TaxID=2044507 RepID=UPI001009A70D|nr:hypothetical protein [Arcobacter sp. CECT 8986]RXJ98369.1 hypothetical protein CRU98_10040 [Arcobacter sp. CECT 8986]
MKASQIGESAIDDFVDELTTGITYKYANEYFKPLEDKIDSDSIMGEALESALNTLKFMTMNAVIITVTEYAMARIIATSGTIFAYIKGTSIASRTRNKLQGALTRFGKLGGAIGKLVKGALGVVIGTQEERLVMAQMANSNVNNISSIIAQERQNQIHMRNGKINHFNSVLSSSQQQKRTTSEDKNALFLHKMKTGTWKKTKQDKDLYKRVTGYNFSSGNDVWSKNFIDKLNGFSEYAVSAEGEIINLSQTHLDYITSTGFTKVK